MNVAGAGADLNASVGGALRSNEHAIYGIPGSGDLTDLACRTAYVSCMEPGRTLSAACSSSWRELRPLMSIFSPSVSLTATTVRLAGLGHRCRSQGTVHCLLLTSGTFF